MTTITEEHGELYTARSANAATKGFPAHAKALFVIAIIGLLPIIAVRLMNDSN